MHSNGPGRRGGPLRSSVRKRRRVGWLVPVVAAISLVVTTAPAAANTMFTHSASSGEIAGGRLTLRGVGPRVTWMHSNGRSGVAPVKRVHRRLFPPRKAATGTLHFEGHRGGDETTVRLSRPRHDPARGTVSYRVTRSERSANASQVGSAPATRRFGAASLSVVPHKTLVGGYYGGNDCGQAIVNETGWSVRLKSQSKWDTDTWGPAVPDGRILGSAPDGTQIEFWRSNGGLWRGCSNTVVWELWPGPDKATFTIVDSFYWGESETTTCVSSNPEYTCNGPSPWWVLRRDPSRRPLAD